MVNVVIVVAPATIAASVATARGVAAVHAAVATSISACEFSHLNRP